MNGGVRHEYPLGFHAVTTPGIVQAGIGGEVAPQDGTVQRTDGVQRQRQHLFQEGLYLEAIFAADIKIVATGFAGPVPIFFREITAFGQGPEFSEGIGAEEDAVGVQIGHHHLRPMHHGGAIESQAAAAQGKGITLFYHPVAAGQVQAVEELSQHLQGLGRGHHLQGGILPGHPGNQARVVRFQMMHHQIIRRASAQGFHEVLLPRLRATGIDGIHNGHFLVLNQIRIIGHSLRHIILAFEQVQIHIVRPDISHRFVDFLDHVGYGFSIQI